MTKNDYQNVADVLAQQYALARDLRDNGGQPHDARQRLLTLDAIADGLARDFAARNPRFDIGKFYEAATVFPNINGH